LTRQAAAGDGDGDDADCPDADGCDDGDVVTPVLQVEGDDDE